MEEGSQLLRNAILLIILKELIYLYTIQWYIPIGRCGWVTDASLTNVTCQNWRYTLDVCLVSWGLDILTSFCQQAVRKVKVHLHRVQDTWAHPIYHIYFPFFSFPAWFRDLLLFSTGIFLSGTVCELSSFIYLSSQFPAHPNCPFPFSIRSSHSDTHFLFLGTERMWSISFTAPLSLSSLSQFPSHLVPLNSFSSPLFWVKNKNVLN